MFLTLAGWAILIVMLPMVIDICYPFARPTITKRLCALGVTEELLQSGMLMGISNPARSSLKKMIIEEDVGMLWIDDNAISYRGDTDAFRIEHFQLEAVERTAHPWSTASLCGAVHVIIHFRNNDGTLRQVRFHPEGCLTYFAVKKSHDALAALLNGFLHKK